MTEEELFEKLITSEVYEDTLLAMTIMPEKWKNLKYGEILTYAREKHIKLYAVLLNYYVDNDNTYNENLFPAYRLKRFENEKYLISL